MNAFKIHILGCGSALPTLRHNASSQVVEMGNKFFMIDCGEGTQTQLRYTHIHFAKLQAIFISHLHGDHCFGLLGLLSTFGMLGRTAPMHVYAPQEFETIFREQLAFFCATLGFEIVFHGLDTTQSKMIYEDRGLTVTTIPLQHRVPTCGFLFREKPKLPHINRAMIDFYHVPVSQINNIKAGQDWVSPAGDVIPHEQLTTPADPTRAYAYCSDTRYIPTLHTLLQGVDVLYHESTYTEDCAAHAKKYWHSTAKEAAMVARDARVGRLLLGHYSSRYEDERVLLNEAKTVFEQSMLSDEGLVVTL
ncbi:ribonuclease Z [Segatella oulorum F0390]|uniref:Ribonuclease Z n=1 Tax=Segatella oulorum F0390 TaxID=702438 RepID=G1W955_9BACT|nr:ribonuclease Z [Segatella oulorum]EGV34396.1 ribonuclease Z [Segatella oulorum F0390]